MGGPKSNREVEIKLRASGVGAARRLLRRVGFRVRRRRIFESNVLYDTGTGALRRKHQLLRVRQVGKRAILTFKGTPVTGKHKDREELETELADAGTFGRILDRLGMEPT
ncbi:MAG: class IV adenylate cyclase, partial [bacterium]|nr:class IV adenylate cyclase [bacterium]